MLFSLWEHCDASHICRMNWAQRIAIRIHIFVYAIVYIILITLCMRVHIYRPRRRYCDCHGCCCCYYCCCHYFENERRFLMLPLFLFLSLLFIVTRAHTNGWQFFYTHEINSHFSLNLLYWKLSMCDSPLICRREIRYFFPFDHVVCAKRIHSHTQLCVYLIPNDCILNTLLSNAAAKHYKNELNI